MLDDTRAESVQLGGVQDFDRNFLGRMTAARALLLSRNVATEQAMKMAGIQDVIAFAHSLGITTSLAPYISTAIGTSSVKMIDHASAYAAFANGGHKVTAYGILKVVDGNGNVLADHTQPPGEGDPMSSAQAWEVTKILRDYARTWHLPVKWDTAGKSGTTENFVDAWYMAYTPDWVVATWAGHTSGTTQAEVGMKEVFGVTMAQYITVPFINTLPKPAAFTPVNGVSTDCSAQDQSVINQSGCPSLTPSSTPTLTTPTPPTATPFPSPPTTRPTPTPSTPSPTPTSSFPTPSSSP
jgi:penicillin-binding protein 1A